MPHIKEIRLVDVHFNNATQFYDDFSMKLEGKNTTYDLENGGGKSLLLLMLLQTVLPKSHLRKEKSVSLLFQGGKDRTSHVAVEWILEEGSQYKYLLTGFSARKRKSTGNGTAVGEEDENITAGDIDHINWCIFYNDNKVTGIRSAPLCIEVAGKKTYAGFEDIRKLIQQVKQKGLPAEIFDRIDRYQSFISGHQLIGAEWNIIKGINSGESSIEAYFRQNPTSRKLIENQFLKIIEDVEALNKGGKNNEESLLLADTLIEIRKRLSEYLKLKGHMAEFEKIKDYYAEFGNRNNELLEGFLRFEEYKNQAVAVRNLILQRQQQLKSSEADVLKKAEENRASVAEGSMLLKLLQAGLVFYEITELEKEKESLLAKQNSLLEGHEELEKKYFDAMALEEYGEYRKAKSRLLEAQKSLSMLETDMDKANGDYRTAGGNLKYLLNQNFARVQAAESEKKSSLTSLEAERQAKNDELIGHEKQKSTLEAEINPLEKKIMELDGAEGKKGEILKDIPENETKELPVYENEKQYQDEISFTQELTESYRKELVRLDGEMRKINGEGMKMNTQADFYDSFIRRTGMTTNSGAIAQELKDFRVFEEEYANQERVITRQCEKWGERITGIRQEAAAFVIIEPLEELSKISRPETAAQCRERQQAFREYINNIDQQIRKISSDILQLESYQQDFTRRCIQRAELVLGHLKKMDALSKIEVNGRRINIIEVKMNEFEEKEKQLRMKNHIDGIVKEISEGGAVDRNRVALKLSTKELLAQVADMDKAVVRLYKIESIPENSRFYRWEHAIGSEGQNNSLYFIFAACLISFIRMLSITNTSLKTKKVIIADNPFGATSAVYLWEPMFQIMKQNHIQLIAPGHRIPREITSRFGVSYLLNQDILQDGRMRVVVKDVRTEEDEEVMQYMNPEQLTLF